MSGQNGGAARDRHKYSFGNQRALHVLVSVLAGVLLLVTYLRTEPPSHYILILDSGSTGTRIYAYTWKERPHQLPLLAAVDIDLAINKVPRRQGGRTRAYERVETEPGLANYIEDTSGLKVNCLEPLLQWAEEVVPPKRHKETPIFLFGTAGLRNLAEEKQDHLLTNIRDILHSSPFRFSDNWAQVLSGEREGIYGWIALNYILGYLSPHPFSASQSSSQATDSEGALESLAEGNLVTAKSEDLKTVGALDLGGSSLEVTFMPMKVSQATTTVNVSILGVQYNLFTQTHENYGLNSAFDRSVLILLEFPEAVRDEENHVWGINHAGLKSSKSRKKGNMDYSTGLQIAASRQAHMGKQGHVINVRNNKRTRTILSNKERASHKRRLHFESGESIEISHPCLHEGYRKEHTIRSKQNNEEVESVILMGRPNWKACDELASLVVNGSQSCENPPCALGLSQPLTTEPMFALTGFYVVYHFFGLPSSATLEELEKKGRRFCDFDWNAIASNRGIEVHVEHYCFRSLYIIKLLRQGLGLPEAQIRLGNGQEEWTLGAALSEGSKVGAGLERNPGIISRPVLFSILAISWAIYTVAVLYSFQKVPRSQIERKPSGPTQSPINSLGSGTSRQAQIGPIPRNISTNSLQGNKANCPNSPTAVVGGGDYSTNVARLSLSTQLQRKRISSVEDLTGLR